MHTHSHHDDHDDDRWKNFSQRRKVITVAFYILVAAITFVLINREGVEISGQDVQENGEFTKAKILSIETEELDGDFEGQAQQVRRRTVEVEIEGSGEKAEVLYEDLPGQYANVDLDEGDTIILTQFPQFEDSDQYFIFDEYRLDTIVIFLFIFLGVVLAITGLKGISSLLGLAFSLLVLIKYVVVEIISGADPLLISFVGGLLIATVSIYLAHGITKKTSIAVVGTILTLLITIIFSYIFVQATGLLGNGSEEAVFTASYVPNLNLQGLLLGGIILGTLGVLDDITTAQVAVVAELKHANPRLGMKELFQKASRVGREHIVSLVNTLVLAYVGTSFPIFLLLLTVKSRPSWVSINDPFISEEIVRSISGSLSLVLAVPITTFIASFIISGAYKSYISLIKGTKGVEPGKRK